MRAGPKRALWIIVAIGAIGLLVWGFLPKPHQVDIAKVVRGRLLVTMDDDGFTRVKERYLISAPAGGVLQRIGLDPGDPLRANETVLAIIDPLEPSLLDARTESVAQARVKASEAAIKRSTATRNGIKTRTEFARSEFARAQELFRGQVRSQEQLDRAKLELDARTEELRAAESDIRVAEFQLEVDRAGLQRTHKTSYENPEDRRITQISPINGRVFRVHRESQGAVTIGEPLLEIADPTALEIVADYLSTDAMKIKPGARVLIEGWGGERVLLGQVRLVEPSGFTKISALGVEEQRVNVVVDFTDPPAQRPNLGDGYRVELRAVVFEREDALKVETGSLFRHGDGWAVFVVVGGEARVRPVEIGQRNGLEAEVLSGLEVDDAVILHPSDDIEDGSAVEQRG